MLLAADFDRDLTVAYQPTVLSGSHQICSFEALVCWSSPELGPVGPNEFIPIAERTDLIFEISRRVLRRALADVAHWPGRIAVKINLSVRDLMSRPQAEWLLAELGRGTVAPNRITFEVTETIFAESLDQVRAKIDLLRSTGASIAIDDFGVGYSSLRYIHALAPEIIKVDLCFVSASTHDPLAQRIIRTIVELARNVGACSVAEGMETAAQADLLAELGCDELQGYVFSRPLSPEAALALAREAAPASMPLAVAEGPVSRGPVAAIA